MSEEITANRQTHMLISVFFFLHMIHIEKSPQLLTTRMRLLSDSADQGTYNLLSDVDYYSTPDSRLP